MNCYCASARHAARLLTRHYEEELRKAGLTPPQFELLGTILSHGELSQGQLARALSFDQTTLSRNLKILIERDLVTRGEAHGDRRRAVYRLSPQGAEVFREAMPLWQQAQQRVEEALGTDKTAVRWAMERMIAVLRAERGGDETPAMTV